MGPDIIPENSPSLGMSETSGKRIAAPGQQLCKANKNNQPGISLVNCNSAHIPMTQHCTPSTFQRL